MVVADPRTPVRLNGPVNDTAGHRRRSHFDHRDLGARGLVAHRIHHVRRLERQQPCLVDRDARFRDALERDRALGDRLAERDTALHPAAHLLERAFREAHKAHAVVNPAGSESALGDIEAAAFA